MRDHTLINPQPILQLSVLEAQEKVLICRDMIHQGGRSISRSPKGHALPLSRNSDFHLICGPFTGGLSSAAE